MTGHQSTRHHQPCGPSDCLLKYVLVTTNLLFWALGLCVLGLGLWGLLEKESLTQERLESLGTDPMLTLATSGLALTLLCLVGCAGALRENSCLMRTFYWITGVLRAAMLGAVARYQDDTDLRFIIDEIQVGLQCCGAENYQDWEINSYFNCTAPGMWACSVPPSCCVDPLENGSVWNSQCGAGARRLDELTAHRVVFLGGCLGAVSRWIEHHSGLIGTVAITLLALQILMLLFTASLLNRIQWNKVSLAHLCVCVAASQKHMAKHDTCYFLVYRLYDFMMPVSDALRIIFCPYTVFMSPSAQTPLPTLRINGFLGL
uniref:Tetraspanin-10 n=1 Tax=Electrophorus electricus TaxID=8005 RepID=A0A4W4HF37_ELEEL